jgi:DNA polymerase III subunit epsilon
MKILVFDTETTGLPIGKNPSIITTHLWPHIVQLSYILYDIELQTILDFVDVIIKLPKGVYISEESENIHRISNKICQEQGVDIVYELKLFNDILNKADIVIGHNISFDKRMIMVECIRNKLQQNFTKNTNRKPEYCTMKKSVDLCKIVAIGNNGDQYYKYPKLIELYKYLFNSVPDGLHNSMIDVLACLRCYGKIEYNVDFLEVSESLKIFNNTLSKQLELSKNI